jgi:two-component system, LytTR family, response regulator
MIKLYKAIIIDDEEDSRNVLFKLLTLFCKEIEVTSLCSNITDAFLKINEIKPDVVFLDIQMPSGNGFELLKKFKKVDFEVIFVTSYDQFAIDAIRLSALDYLLKPIETKQLVESIQRLKTKKELFTETLRIENASHNYEKQGLEKRIAIHSADSVHLLELKTIVCLEGERNYSTIYTKTKERFLSSKNLGQFELILENQPEFIRISKSHLINLNFVTNYTKKEPCTITLNKNFTIEVSRRRRQEILNRIKESQ